MNSEEQNLHKTIKKILEKIKDLEKRQIENTEIFESLSRCLINISIDKIRDVIEESIYNQNKEMNSENRKLCGKIECFIDDKKYDPYKTRPIEMNIEKQILHLNNRIIPLVESSTQMLERVEVILEVIKRRVS